MMTTPMPTHLPPMVPLAWALRAAGHEVLVAGQPDVQDMAHAAGLDSVCVGGWFHHNDWLSPYLPPGVRPLEALGRDNRMALAGNAKTVAVHARYLIPAYLEVARDWRPDLVVGEQLDFAAPVVAGVLGVPSVRHRWGVDPLSGPARPIAEVFLDGLCRRLGLDGLPEPALVLDPCPPVLQVPDAAPGTPIRFVPFNGRGTRPEWVRRRRAARRVCVTFGQQTLLLNGMPLLRHVLAAFDGLRDTEAVVTVDPSLQPGLGDLPDAVRVVDPTPLSLFLDTCDAIVHHGGCGTAMTATAAGLPQLVLPQIMDQFAAGDAVAAVGAGLSVERAADQDDPRRVREALGALLTEDGYRAAAAELAAAVRRMPSPARVALDLEQLVAESAGSAESVEAARSAGAEGAAEIGESERTEESGCVS